MRTATVMGVGILSIAMAGVGVRGVQAATSAAPTDVTVPLPPISTVDPTQWTSAIMLDQGTILQGLAGYNAKNQVVPEIATHWTTTDNGRVWTFYLRHDAKWSNGKPVTAEDFYYAWMREISPQNTTSAVWESVMQYAVNAYLYHAGGCKASQVGLQVVNPYELKLTLTTPHDIVGELPISGSMPLYGPDVTAHPGTWYLPQNFVGDGPYVIKSFVYNGQITLTRNPYFVAAPGQPGVGNVQEITIVPTPTVPVEDYISNKLDTAIISNIADYQYIISHPSLKAQLHVSPEAYVTYLEWDKSTVASPLDSLLVRQAVAMAIDRSPIVSSVLDGMARSATAFAYPGWPTYGYEHGLPYNVKAARALLAKAGYPDGKGIPTLSLYCQTQAVSPSSVSTAEAIQQELKQALNVNTVIDPLATTLWTNVTWNGLNQGIAPGYNIGSGWANWPDPGNLPLQSDQMTYFDGTIGPVAYRDHIANYYFPTYDPNDVKLWGNPNNASMGVTFAQWLPLQKSAQEDIAYLSAWTAKQPAAYRQLLIIPGAQSNQQVWNTYVAAWKAAKSPAAKHAAWVNAWKFVGNYSAGNGGANVGLNGQVYVDQHEPEDVYLMQKWGVESNAAPAKQGIALASQMTNLLMQQGYAVPLYYNETFYLEKPWLHGVQANPWALLNFYQLQYMHTN